MSLSPVPQHAAIVLCRDLMHHLLRPGAGGAYDRARLFGMRVDYGRQKALLVEVTEWLDDLALVLGHPTTERDAVIVLLEGMRPLVQRAEPGVLLAAATRILIGAAGELGLSREALQRHLDQALGLEEQVARAREAFTRPRKGEPDGHE